MNDVSSGNLNAQKDHEDEVFRSSTVNTVTITSGKIPMFGWNQDGGNNYKCRKQF